MPTFQVAGTDWVDQQQLKRCSSAGSNEGHFLKTRYGTWSAGLGADEDLRPEMTALSSSSVNGAVDMGMEGGVQSVEFQPCELRNRSHSFVPHCPLCASHGCAESTTA